MYYESLFPGDVSRELHVFGSVDSHHFNSVVDNVVSCLLCMPKIWVTNILN